MPISSRNFLTFLDTFSPQFTTNDLGYDIQIGIQREFKTSGLVQRRAMGINGDFGLHCRAGFRFLSKGGMFRDISQENYAGKTLELLSGKKTQIPNYGARYGTKQWHGFVVGLLISPVCEANNATVTCHLVTNVA